MSWHPADDPTPGDKKSCDALETVIVPRVRDLGEFSVRRALPSEKRQMVGPFIFWDQMGPAEFLTGEGIDVRPHPHIGLATLTYLFEGEIHHRDSLGTDLKITPGAVNLMGAGQGIVHSERTSPEKRDAGQHMFGIQSWIALPKEKEEQAPEFFHHAKSDLPVVDGEGKTVRIIAGSLYGKTAPTKTYSDMFYGDAVLAAGTSIPLPADHEDRAVYVASGEVTIAGDTFGDGQLLVFRPGDEITIVANADSRILLLGGATLEGPRHIWWNFVSSSKERIDQAKEDWRQGRFDTVPGDEEEFIPLP